jgi:hypothetical protein
MAVERRGSDGVTVYGYDLTGFLAYERNEGRGRERTITYACGVVIGWTESKPYSCIKPGVEKEK